MAVDIINQIVKPTALYINGRIQTYAATANLLLSAWQVGDVGEQVLQAVSFTIEAFAGIITGLTRAGFGETAMDPGDDPDDPDPDYTAPKWLSYWGEGQMGTKRKTKTFATGFVTLTNAPTGQTRTIAPFELTFTRNNPGDTGEYPTYKNSVDPAIYTGSGANGSFDLQPGQSVVIPIVADVEGTLSNAAPGEIDSISSVLLGVTVANTAPVTGSDGEPRAVYVARCRASAGPTSPGGPADAYRYLATTLPGGDPLRNALGAVVNISRVQVVPDSAFNTADVYYAAPSGAAISADVTAANANIIKYGVGTTVNFGPSSSPVGGVSATEVSIPVTYTAKIKGYPGLDVSLIYPDVTAVIRDFIDSADIGGFDPTLGVGVIYTNDIEGEIKSTRRAGTGSKWGLYDVIVTTPAGATTTINIGEVATLGAVSGTVTAV